MSEDWTRQLRQLNRKLRSLAKKHRRHLRTFTTLHRSYTESGERERGFPTRVQTIIKKIAEREMRNPE